MTSDELYRYIIIGSLINASIFYAFTVVVFLMARKTRLNKALATQKFIWLLIITTLVLPAYIWGFDQMPLRLKMGLWGALSVATWWVLYEVYRANWYGGLRAFFRALYRGVWCRVSGRCRVGE